MKPAYPILLRDPKYLQQLLSTDNSAHAIYIKGRIDQLQNDAARASEVVGQLVAVMLSFQVLGDWQKTIWRVLSIEMGSSVLLHELTELMGEYTEARISCERAIREFEAYCPGLTRNVPILGEVLDRLAELGRAILMYTRGDGSEAEMRRIIAATAPSDIKNLIRDMSTQLIDFLKRWKEKVGGPRGPRPITLKVLEGAKVFADSIDGSLSTCGDLYFDHLYKKGRKRTREEGTIYKHLKEKEDPRGYIADLAKKHRSDLDLAVYPDTD